MFKYLDKSLKITFWMLILMFAVLLFINNCSGQTVFTQAGKQPENMGSFATTTGYTINFDLATDAGFHLKRQSTIYEWGNNRMYVQYPYIYFGSGIAPLGGMIGYQNITDGNYHRWTIRVGVACRLQLLIDSVMIGEQVVTPAALVNSGNFYLGSSSDIDKLSGTIRNFRVTASYDTLKKEFPYPAPVYDSRNTPRGYVTGDWSNVASCYQQLVSYPAPKYAPGVYPKIHPMFDFYKAGGEDFGISPDSCTKAGVAIAKILCDKFNCDLRVCGNTEDYMSYRNLPASPHGKFNAAMIALANANPSYELRVDCSLSQLDDINGYHTITTAQSAVLLPNAPMSTYDGMREILFIHYTTIQMELERKITTAMIDNEFLPGRKFLDTLVYAANPQCNAAKIASGLSWIDYCSKQYTAALNHIYDGIRRACPGINIVEYDVNCLDECKYYYDAQFKDRIALNTTGMGSEQVYPRSPFFSLIGGGDYRGLLNSYLLNKRGQIKQGRNLSTPFIGVGYKGIPEQDINPTYTLGIETFVIACGSPSLWPSLYVQGGNNPNPKAYAYQMVAATYAQAANSRVWDIVINGKLLEGDRSCAWLCYGGTNYTYWCGDYETITTVKKLGSRYAITCLRGSQSNLKTGVPYRREFPFILNVKSFNLNARMQCSVWEYDESKPILTDKNPRLVNQWAQFGDYSNW